MVCSLRPHAERTCKALQMACINEKVAPPPTRNRPRRQLVAKFHALPESLAGDASGMAAWMLPCVIAMCVEGLREAVKRVVMAAWMLPGASFGEEMGNGGTKPIFSAKSGCRRRCEVPRVCSQYGCDHFIVGSVFLCAVHRVVVHVCIVIVLCAS